MKTFIVSLKGEEDPSQDLQYYTKNHLTVECGNYSCLNFKSVVGTEVFLNNESHPSKNVQLHLEELKYNEDRYGNYIFWKEKYGKSLSVNHY